MLIASLGAGHFIFKYSYLTKGPHKQRASTETELDVHPIKPLGFPLISISILGKIGSNLVKFLSIPLPQFIFNFNRKRRRAPVIEDSDSEEGGAQNSGKDKKLTRKQKMSQEAEEILKSDPETKDQHGFSEESIDIAQVKVLREDEKTHLKH